MKFTKVDTEDKDKEGKEKGKKPKKLFNKTCLRKTLRLSVLIVILFLVVAVPLIVFNFLYRVQYTSLPANANCMIIMSNCRLYINEDPSQDPSTASVTIIAPGTSFLIYY